jgi:hypothetical protein
MISFAATPQSREAQQARTYTDPSAGAPPSRRSGYNAPYVDLGHWNKVFTDQTYFDSIAKQKGMTEGAKVSLHGDDYVYRQAMIGYLADTRKVPLDDMRSIFDAEKDGFAKTVLGKQTASAREMFDWQKGQFERSNEKKAAADQILQGVIRRSLEDALSGGDTPFVESVGKDIDAAAEMFDDEEKSRLWEKAEELDIKIRASQDKFAPEARFIFDALQQSTGQKTGFGAPDMRDMASRFAQLPDNQRKAIYELAGGFAQITQTDKGFWYQMAESLGRGASDIVERVPRNFREQTLRGQLRLLNSDQPVFRATGVAGAEFSAAGSTPVFGATQGQMLTPEEREEAKSKIQSDLGILKVERELRDLAERVVDPIKTIGVLPEIIEEGLYGAARSIPYTAVAAVPIAGVPAVASALFSSNYDRIMLEYPDLDPDKAALIAAISAPIEAGLERMKVNTITGRLPVFGGLVKRLQHPNQRNITRIAIGGAGIVAEQNVQEIVQNATFPFVQTIAAALDADMPDYDWDERLAGMPRELAVQFVALLPLSLMGVGALSYREISRGENYLKSKADLEKAGYNEEQIDRITGAESAEAAQAALVEEHAKRDPKLVKAAAQRIVDESIALREKANPAALPRLEKQGADYVVLSPEGKELARTTDQTAAEQALVSARRETVQREMRSVTNGINLALEFINKANEARSRGEDIQKFILENRDNDLFQDYEANPTEQNLERLFETVTAFGFDAKEPEDLKNFPVLASNQGALRDGIYRSIVRIFDGADGTIVMRDFAQDNLKRAMAEGRVSIDWVRSKLNELIPQIDSERIERKLRTDTDTDVIEAFSDVAIAYFRGRITEDMIPEGFRGFFRRMAVLMADIFRRSYRLARLRAEGKLDRDFEALLAEAVGVDQQALVDRSREKTAQEVAPEVANYSIGALGDDNPFMHPRGADGKYKGAPKWVNAPKTRRGKDEAYMRLRERLYQLVKEGEAGRFWYEDSGRAVLRMFNNDVVEAEKFIELLAIYSPQATVEVNTYFALRAYIQRAVNAAKEDFAVKTGTQDDKAKAVLYDNQPWAGRKTDNFYKNIMYVLLKELPASEVAKLKLDAEVYEMLQKPVTVDMWVYRAFGFDSDALTDVAGTGAFGFAERELNLIAEELNASLPEGAAPYLPHQIQAMLWTSIKGRSETKKVKDLTEAQSMKAKDMVKVKNAQGKLVREFKDKEAQKRHMQRWITNALALPAERLDVSMAAGAFDRFINSVSMRALWESVPSTNTPEGVAITNLPTAQKAAFTRASREIILDENGNDMLAAMLGVPVNVSQLLSGGYGTEATPNVVTELFPNKPSGTYDDDVVRAYARAIQYIFRQDAVPWMRYIKYGAENEKSYYAESPKGAKRRFATQAEAEAYAAGKEGYVVKGDAENLALMLDFGEQLTPEFLDQLQQGLVKIHDSLGFTQVSPTEVIVTNFRDAETGLPALTDEQFYQMLSGAYGATANIQELYTVGEYGPVHDWSADPEGGTILSASSRFTPDLLEWLRGRRQISDALQKDWAEGRGVDNYSISTQSEIDRVGAALNRLDRDPLERVKIYEKAQEKFLRVMADNREMLASAQDGDLAQMRRTQILQALGELDGIISVLPPEVRSKIGGYTQLAKVDPMDVYKGDQKVSEVRGMSGAIISAWMREGLNIGEAQKKTELPAGYRAERNLDPTRADRAIADVFIQRINRINEALEQFLRDEYNTAAVELFKRAKPQRSGAGEKPKGKLGADVHDLFDKLKEATEWSAEEAQAYADGQWARIENGELNPYEETHAMMAAQMVPLFADWANADSSQRAAAVTMGKDVLNRAYKGEQQRIIAQRTKRGYDRTDLSKDAGVSAEDDKARQDALKRENSLPSKWESAMLNLLNFDQVLRYVFGNDSKIARQISDRQRKADNAKSDDIAALSDEWAAFLSELGGGEMQGQQLLFELSRMDEEIDGVSYSQNQLIAISMMWMQPKGRQHMEGFLDSDGQPAGKWHYNQDFVNKAEKLLRGEAKAIRQYLLDKYDAEYEAINKVYRKVYGLNLPKNQFYSPLVVESIRAPAQAGIDPVTGGVFAAGANSPSALRSRGGAIAQPVFRDAVQTYFGHMLQMAHWKAYAEFNGEVSALLGHRDTRNVVKGKAGEQAATVMNNWLQYFQQGGNKDAANHLAINQWINRMTGNFAVIALFGRISTLALQVTQLGAASAKMPVGAYLSRFGKLMSGRLGWTTALDSDYIQRRIKDMPPAVALAMQGLRADKPSQIRNASRWLGQHLSGFDGFFTAGTYAIVYDYQLSQARQNGMGGQEAADYAREATERIVDEIAQPTRAGARSIYELNSTNPVARAVWAFSSESRKNMGLLMYNGAKGGGRDFGKALTYVLLLNGLVGIVIRNAFRDMRDEDDEEIFDEKNWGWKRLAAQFISDPIYGIPVVGETIESGVYAAFSVYQPSGPVFDVTRGVPAAKRLGYDHPMAMLEGEAEFRDIVADVNRVLAAAGLFNGTIAGAASISNLAKDVFEVGDNVFSGEQ